MATIHQLSASLRDKKKEGNHQLRVKGEIPAILYDKKKGCSPLKIKNKDLKELLASHHHLIKLSFDGKDHLAIPKEVQVDPVTKKLIHVSLEGVQEGNPIHITLPIHFTYEKDCEWVKNKGIMQHDSMELSVEVLPENLPDQIDIDINHLKIGDTLKVADLNIPNLKFLDKEDYEIVSIHHAKKVVETPEEETEKTEAAS